jgi:hypothetical protein
MTNACSQTRFRYPYEEFADHLKAMPIVGQWEYTSRFGHLGPIQTNRAKSARVLDYFSDSYPDWREAVHKAEIFLRVSDFVARHADLLSSKGLLERKAGDVYWVEYCLLRALHHLFSAAASPKGIELQEVLRLTESFQRIEAGD